MSVAARQNNKDLIEEAKRVLYGNLKSGYSQWADENYKYVSPSPRHYSYQWFWDSCFHAIVLSHFDLDLAKNEIRNLLKGQEQNGFIPHVIFWSRGLWAAPWSSLESKLSISPKTTQLIQPPLLAEAVEAIFKKEKNHDFLYETLPKLKSYYRWLSKNRDPDGDDLISIIAPYESGLDQSPSFDTAIGVRGGSSLLASIAGRTIDFKNMMRGYNLEKIFEDDYFNVEDVLVNSIYIKNLQILSKLLHEVDDEESARALHHLSQRATESLIKKCYDKEAGFFFDLSSKNEERLQTLTIKGLVPIILDLPKSIVNNLVKKHVLNHEEFDLPFPIPTVARSEPSFLPYPKTLAGEPIIWRGPTWINTNWYIVQGLKKHGYKKEAKKIVDKSVDLVRTSGYREFFNPLTGEGYGAKNFGWSTLVVDMILS